MEPRGVRARVRRSGRGRRRRLGAVRARARWSSPRTSTGARIDARAVRSADSIFYEVHVKGFTKLHPDVPDELRGTYAGVAHPAAVSHLKRLGVTAVELLPVHQFVHDAQLVARGLRNYWGYQSIGYFAPHNEYSSSGDGGGQVDEFRRMVRDSARGRARGDPRRGLQPHRRGQRVGTHAVLPRNRQRGLLPARRRPRSLRRRHRLRQHRRPAPAPAAAAGDGRAPLLGAGDARRRLPLRPGGRARTWGERLRPLLLVPRGGRPGPGTRAGEADRRAVGYRSLRRRTVPARVERMEREVSRHRARFLARNRGRASGSSDARQWLTGSLRERRPAAGRVGEHPHRPRRLHACGPRQLQRQAQRGQRREQPRRHR